MPKKESKIETTMEYIINNFNIEETEVADFKIQLIHTKIKVIEAIDGQLITKTYIGEIDLDVGNEMLSRMWKMIFLK